MPDEKAADKAPYGAAAEALFRGTVKAALSTEAEHPEMELDRLTVDWAVPPRFRVPDLALLADTDDPDAKPWVIHAEYVRNRTPKLKE